MSSGTGNEKKEERGGNKGTFPSGVHVCLQGHESLPLAVDGLSGSGPMGDHEGVNKAPDGFLEAYAIGGERVGAEEGGGQVSITESDL